MVHEQYVPACLGVFFFFCAKFGMQVIGGFSSEL